MTLPVDSALCASADPSRLNSHSAYLIRSGLVTRHSAPLVEGTNAQDMICACASLLWRSARVREQGGQKSSLKTGMKQRMHALHKRSRKLRRSRVSRQFWSAGKYGRIDAYHGGVAGVMGRRPETGNHLRVMGERG